MIALVNASVAEGLILNSSSFTESKHGLGRKGYCYCPQNSADLTPLDFVLLRYIDADKSQTTHQIKENIVKQSVQINNNYIKMSLTRIMIYRASK